MSADLDWTKSEIFLQEDAPKAYQIELWSFFFWLPLLLILAHGTIWFIIANVRRDLALIDAAYGLNFMIVNTATIYLRASQGGLDANFDMRAKIVVLLSWLYAARMFHYIMSRTKAGTEDRRFAELRENLNEKEHPCRFMLFTYLIIFTLTGVQIFIINMPGYIICERSNGEPLGMLDYFAVGLWVLAWLYETVADCQLLDFKRKREAG